MSETTTTTTAQQPERLFNDQLIVALYAMTISAGALFGVFMLKEISAVQAGLVGGAIAAPLGGVVGFYFASSKGSQKKDDTIASAQVALANSTPAPLPPGTVTTTEVPATTTTTTTAADPASPGTATVVTTERTPP